MTLVDPRAKLEAKGQPQAQLRNKINEIDRRLLALFSLRMQVARQIGRGKMTSGQAVYDPVREQYLLDKVAAGFADQDGLRAQNLISTLMRMSRGAQYDILRQEDSKSTLLQDLLLATDKLLTVQRVIYQGALGSYSSQAARLLYPQAQISSALDFAQACQAVVLGQADVAVLPWENTTAGTVDDVYDLLIEHKLSIHRSLSLPISHCLLAIEGTQLSDIKTVLSHPQALAQSSAAIEAYGWQTEPSLNTAYAAAQVKKTGRKDLAAIASAEAAGANGLAVLLSGINNSDLNRTRFVVVARELTIEATADRLSLVLELPHKSGSLASSLALFADRGINLSKIQSRPLADKPWSYLFYLDADCRPQDPEALSMLYQLSQEMPYFKLLGWYKELDPQADQA